MKHDAFSTSLFSVIFFCAGVLAMDAAIRSNFIQLTPYDGIRKSGQWSKWSAPYERQDDTFHSIHYTIQQRTNLDTGLIELRSVN